ncbi:hypothetical protein U9M48_012172 [Paspalum notatum var. saurae]|uniref:Transposase n=1 Tax=Paspalum notatum var. saurae TaxID=547442 RepID=A0AAQ3SXD8_PASNO
MQEVMDLHLPAVLLLHPGVVVLVLGLFRHHIRGIVNLGELMVSLLIYFNILNQLLSKCIMDKSWMDMPRQTNEYIKGVDNFLDFAFSNSAKANKILCPCKACQNCFWGVSDVVREHLICEGFTEGYDTNEEDDISDLLRDLDVGLDDNCDLEGSGKHDLEGSGKQEDEDMESFYKLVEDASQALYLGCRNFLKFRFIIRLLHIKFLGGWSGKSFDMLLASGTRERRWHDEERIKDGLLRHPADAPFWKDFDSSYPDFASDSRNLRLAVASDGFSPLKTFNSTYSIWPVILIPYNLPPWKCMKQTNFILSLVISGPRALGADMDVYLKPFVDDMVDMCVKGIRTYDAFKDECFQLHVAILCSISDLPGLGYLHGCVSSGKVSCPECHSHECSLQLKKGGKYVFVCHRRFLDANHIFRSLAELFDGTEEHRPAPVPLSGEEILELTANMHTSFGKDPTTKKPANPIRRGRNDAPLAWKRKSIWQMYSPTIRKLEAEIAETLSILETIFVPAFFDTMVHLMVHLPAQARIGAPVQYRSMWAIERFLMRLKGYVCTKSHPEGSICEAYKFDESLTFCSQFLRGCETRFTRHPFNYTKCFSKHIEYLRSIGHRNQRKINSIHHEIFHEWFRKHVKWLVENGMEVPEEMQILANETFMLATMYNSYTINGFNFHTYSSDEGRSVQNSGVALVAQTSCFENGNMDPIVRNKTYYGRIKEIIELNYRNKGNVVLFKCDWVDNRIQDTWVKTDQFGTTLVNFNHLFNTGERSLDEPFILASQATQVYYVQDPIDREWSAVVRSKPREIYDMAASDSEEVDQQNEFRSFIPDLYPNVYDLNIFLQDVIHVRTDIDGTIVSEKRGRDKMVTAGEKKKGRSSLRI